jgi:hypothetical protein
MTKQLSFVAFLVIAVSQGHAETWRFAVIGDTPYNSYERRELPLMLEDIAAEFPEFIIHAGDFKASNARCSDEILNDRKNLFSASNVPFIYVPGDNEWSDCDRVLSGHFDERERLAKLRELFFAEPRSLGDPGIPVEQQSTAFPEHLRWRLGPVLLVTLNVPGPNNNFGMGREPSAEFTERNPMVIEWLQQGFAKARREQFSGIVIVMQGNPGFKDFATGYGHSGYRDLLATLNRETREFNGQVLLVHGDTHWQRIDHPLRDPETNREITNFTRLETFGYPFMGWVKVIVDSDVPSLFRFHVKTYTPDANP